MKWKENRVVSFLAVAAIYLLASLGGILLYGCLPWSWWLNLLVADIAATGIVFLFSLLFGNASVYDPYWSVQPMVILGGFAAVRGVNLYGILLLAVTFLWGLRLTANWAYTFQNLRWQDWRYTMLKEKTGCFYPLINLAGIHLFPTLVVYLCVLPAVYALEFSVPFSPRSLPALAVCLGAVILQGVADLQMHLFRREKTGGFIRRGLWEHSRHPNYLGEILMWWGIGLSLIPAVPDRYALLAGAAVNTMMFLVVSIPMADRRQSRKAGFAEYKAQTRMLLPIKKGRRKRV